MSKRVYVGIGHGGSDPGAVANGFKEKDLTLSIGKYCNERLKQYGIETKIIADKIKINLYSISSFLNIVKVVIIRNPEKIQTKA